MAFNNTRPQIASTKDGIIYIGVNTVSDYEVISGVSAASVTNEINTSGVYSVGTLFRLYKENTSISVTDAEVQLSLDKPFTAVASKNKLTLAPITGVTDIINYVELRKAGFSLHCKALVTNTQAVVGKHRKETITFSDIVEGSVYSLDITDSSGTEANSYIAQAGDTSAEVSAALATSISGSAIVTATDNTGSVTIEAIAVGDGFISSTNGSKVVDVEGVEDLPQDTEKEYYFNSIDVKNGTIDMGVAGKLIAEVGTEFVIKPVYIFKNKTTKANLINAEFTRTIGSESDGVSLSRIDNGETAGLSISYTTYIKDVNGIEFYTDNVIMENQNGSGTIYKKEGLVESGTMSIATSVNIFEDATPYDVFRGTNSMLGKMIDAADEQNVALEGKVLSFEDDSLIQGAYSENLETVKQFFAYDNTFLIYNGLPNPNARLEYFDTINKSSTYKRNYITYLKDGESLTIADIPSEYYNASGQVISFSDTLFVSKFEKAIGTEVYVTQGESLKTKAIVSSATEIRLTDPVYIDANAAIKITFDVSLKNTYHTKKVIDSISGYADSKGSALSIFIIPHEEMAYGIDNVSLLFLSLNAYLGYLTSNSRAADIFIPFTPYSKFAVKAIEDMVGNDFATIGYDLVSESLRLRSPMTTNGLHMYKYYFAVKFEDIVREAIFRSIETATITESNKQTVAKQIVESAVTSGLNNSAYASSATASNIRLYEEKLSFKLTLEVFGYLFIDDISIETTVKS